MGVLGVALRDIDSILSLNFAFS
ncbi:hypothetical protein JL09_g6743 [Pichia kudriavzevii]|uniref:Uncharacterized protein n=1 Tax=Pichia kudriavzevii TaxID=4909 RepID=A0A099NJA3_PICKU|nr:hypothetical protein JL09_g6743 [Pichia kudriavzevii]